MINTDNLGFSITNIDASADPKQDIYRFAAGGWLDRAVIPDTESQVNGYTQLKRRVNEQIMALLQNAAEASTDAPKGSSESTRAFALAKLDSLVIRVGYPDKWIDYSSVDIRRDDYLGNALRLNRFEFERNLARAGKPVVNDEFFMAGFTLPTDINAAYQPQANKIEICAAFLQPPFFYPDLDAAVNCGTLGAVIGHEMTHGFDSTGRHFDAAGNMTDWWTADDSGQFEAFTEQLVEQFNRYEVLPGVFVNGKLTVGENTADLGGVTLAFAALKASLAAVSYPGGYNAPGATPAACRDAQFNQPGHPEKLALTWDGSGGVYEAREQQR